MNVLRRLGPARYVLAAVVAVLLVLTATGRLTLLAALMSAGVIAMAALIRVSVRPEDADAPAAAASAAAPDTGLSDLIAALPDPVVVLDRHGVIVAFNSNAQTLAPALRRGGSAFSVLRVPAVIEAIRMAAASGIAQRAEFSERVPVDRWYEAHVMPIAAAAEAARGLLVLSFRDLTPLRQVEQMRADFVANASHELRTPLAALSGFIDTLQGPAREDAAAREKFLAIMREQAGRMARLIDDLLSLSRIELNAHIPPSGEVELVALLRQVADGLQMLSRERGVEVVIAAPAALTVRGDRDELIRVFENLVENALKYGGSGHRVEITAELMPGEGAERPEIRVAVRDFGPGIAPEHLPRLTERFYRVDVGHSRAVGGTGLGLSLVKHILNRHRGRLAIDSVVGNGSRFVVHLPQHGPRPDVISLDQADT